jgi:hypothetical protein
MYLVQSILVNTRNCAYLLVLANTPRLFCISNTTKFASATLICHVLAYADCGIFGMDLEGADQKYRRWKWERAMLEHL